MLPRGLHDNLEGRPRSEFSTMSSALTPPVSEIRSNNSNNNNNNNKEPKLNNPTQFPSPQETKKNQEKNRPRPEEKPKKPKNSARIIITTNMVPSLPKTQPSKGVLEKVRQQPPRGEQPPRSATPHCHVDGGSPCVCDLRESFQHLQPIPTKTKPPKTVQPTQTKPQARHTPKSP